MKLPMSAVKIIIINKLEGLFFPIVGLMPLVQLSWYCCCCRPCWHKNNNQFWKYWVASSVSMPEALLVKLPMSAVKIIVINKLEGLFFPIVGLMPLVHLLWYCCCCHRCRRKNNNQFGSIGLPHSVSMPEAPLVLLPMPAVKVINNLEGLHRPSVGLMRLMHLLWYCCCCRCRQSKLNNCTIVAQLWPVLMAII